jgi:hypothetical protein
MGLLLNKYTAISVAVQIVAVVLIWTLAFIFSPAGDRFFGLMFYFYFPPIFLLSYVLNLRGESGMIAGAIYGMAFGVIVYGFAFGLVMSVIRRR